MLAEYEHQQYGQRKNLAVCNEHERLVYLYRMSDLPISQYRTRNYPNPYINTDYVVTQTEHEPVRPLKTEAWQGGSRHRVNETVKGEPVAFNGARRVRARGMGKHAYREVRRCALSLLHEAAAGSAMAPSTVT